jgi:hypothetical protein
MNKKLIIVSMDDFWEGNDHWDTFVELKRKFPKFKATFFTNPGQCSDEFLKKAQVSWIDLAYHCQNHSGGYKNWTKEEAKEYLQKYHDEYNFGKGFKAPGWKITNELIEACRELNFWIASINTIRLEYDKMFYTHYKKREGLNFLQDYTEYYGHFQSYNFEENIKELDSFCSENDPDFLFINEYVNA